LSAKARLEVGSSIEIQAQEGEIVIKSASLQQDYSLEVLIASSPEG
jgi:hypothetical protein